MTVYLRRWNLAARLSQACRDVPFTDLEHGSRTGCSGDGLQTGCSGDADCKPDAQATDREPDAQE